MDISLISLENGAKCRIFLCEMGICPFWPSIYDTLLSSSLSHSLPLLRNTYYLSLIQVEIKDYFTKMFESLLRSQEYTKKKKKKNKTLIYCRFVMNQTVYEQLEPDLKRYLFMFICLANKSNSSPNLNLNIKRVKI